MRIDIHFRNSVSQGKQLLKFEQQYSYQAKPIQAANASRSWWVINRRSAEYGPGDTLPYHTRALDGVTWKWHQRRV